MMIELRKPTKISPSLLKFDSQNPRLISTYHFREDSNDLVIIEALKATADLDELLSSIAANGYVDVEPMLILGEVPPYCVLEGNRRLAAIKLFLDPNLAKSAKITVPEISEEFKNSLDQILVYRVEKEEEARAYIGFKHINGPHRWDSLAKARYAARWFKEGTVSVLDISKKLGDSHDTVRKMLYGIFVLEQAEEAEIFDIENRYPSRQFPFSHLYTALTRKQYRDFLGIQAQSTAKDPTPNPVPVEKLDNLQKVLHWLYGNKNESTRPVIASQNPDIKYLAAVISNSRALEVLEQKHDLKLAYISLSPVDAIFRENLVKAQLASQDALATSYSYNGDPALLDSASRLKGVSETLYAQMQAVVSGKKVIE